MSALRSASAWACLSAPLDQSVYCVALPSWPLTTHGVSWPSSFQYCMRPAAVVAAGFGVGVQLGNATLSFVLSASGVQPLAALPMVSKPMAICGCRRLVGFGFGRMGVPGSGRVTFAYGSGVMAYVSTV